MTLTEMEAASLPALGSGRRPLARNVFVRWIVPMHYGTERVNFPEPPDAFLERMANVERLTATSFDTAEPPDATPLAVVPAAP